jgi:diguanylate cyclase (GGDEF)-like protein/PAS domain S-box-containing protein
MNSSRSVKQAAFQASVTGRVKTWNADCEQLLGYAGKEVLQRSISRLLAPSAKKECRDCLSDCRHSAGSLRTAIVRADGRALDGWLTFAPQFRQSGDLDGYNVIIETLERNKLMPDPAPAFQNEFQKLLDCLGGTFYVIDQAGHFVVWNKKLEKIMKMTGDQIRAAHALEFFDEYDRPVVREKFREIFERGEAFIEADLVGSDGTSIPYLFSGARIELDGRICLCGMGLDMSKQKQQEEFLRLCNRALLASVNGIVITRHEGKDNPAVYINPSFERITGYCATEVIGRDLRFMAAPGLDEVERGKIRAALDQSREIYVTFRNLRKNGELFWNELTIAPVHNNRGEVTHFIGVINDVTASKQRTFHLEHEANHDALTGLANRNLFWDRLDQALYSARRNKGLVAVVFIDLDGFKTINDTEGHEAGDEVLRAISKRLKASVRENDTVARMGGDEFVLILANQPSLRFTLRMIERLRQNIMKPVVAGRKTLHVGASIGISIFPHDSSSGGALLQAADAAMYHAKSAGRNNMQFFSPEMKSAIDAKQELETCLRDAIDRDELFLLFQPRVCLKSGKVMGAEALLRWRHPKRGILHPASFMALAEESGLILPLGEWVLDNCCAMLNHLQGRDLDDFSILTNVSFREFNRPDYIAIIEQKLRDSGIAPHRLEIEIAEEKLMRDPQGSAATLAELDRLGVRVAIDDFGSGFSSLSYLQRFPVSHLTIDRSFIADVHAGGADTVITRTMITMGHNLDIEVVAKGVETGEQLDFLRRHGCDQAQGNYLSAPLGSSDLERLVKTGARYLH